jgi:hypothetical protein
MDDAPDFQDIPFGEPEIPIRGDGMSQTITAVIEKVFNDGPRIDIKLADGKRLTTFREELGRLARKFEGVECRVSYSVSEREKDGKTYKNYYFEGAEPLEEETPGLPDFDPPVTEKDWRIARGNALNSQALAEAVRRMSDDDFSLTAVKLIADDLANYIVKGLEE